MVPEEEEEEEEGEEEEWEEEEEEEVRGERKDGRRRKRMDGWMDKMMVGGRREAAKEEDEEKGWTMDGGGWMDDARMEVRGNTHHIHRIRGNFTHCVSLNCRVAAHAAVGVFDVVWLLNDAFHLHRGNTVGLFGRCRELGTVHVGRHLAAHRAVRLSVPCAPVRGLRLHVRDERLAW